MNRKTAGYISMAIVLVFIAYIIYDAVKKGEPKPVTPASEINDSSPEELWYLKDSILTTLGELSAVTLTADEKIILAGDSFIACYNEKHEIIWKLNTPKAITALSSGSDTVFASTSETVYLVVEGKLIDEYGPYDDNSLITGIASNKSFIAIADAGNKLIFVISKTGELKSILGQKGKRFVIPSPYFDVALTGDNRIIAANTGERKVEIRTFDDRVVSSFGESGTAPGSFCGCCNPSHLAVFQDGIITAEKGINRIKMLSLEGEFTGYVSSVNNFRSSVPLDIAVTGSGKVYAANPANSQLYIFDKKQK
jgi:hypothetical protein